VLVQAANIKFLRRQAGGQGNWQSHRQMYRLLRRGVVQHIQNAGMVRNAFKCFA